MRLLLEYETADVWNHLTMPERVKILSGSVFETDLAARIWSELPTRARMWLWGFLCCRELLKTRLEAVTELVTG